MAHITWEDRSQYFEQIRARIAEMPQVIEAGISTNATPPSNENQTSIEILGSTLEEKPEVRLNLVSPEYFSLLRIPLKMGRVWDHAETMHGAPLAVTYQTMARAYCPYGNAIGQQIKVPILKADPPFAPSAADSDVWLQIVGVVEDALNEGLKDPLKPAV